MRRNVLSLMLNPWLQSLFFFYCSFTPLPQYAVANWRSLVVNVPVIPFFLSLSSAHGSILIKACLFSGHSCYTEASSWSNTRAVDRAHARLQLVTNSHPALWLMLFTSACTVIGCNTNECPVFCTSDWFSSLVTAIAWLKKIEQQASGPEWLYLQLTWFRDWCESLTCMSFQTLFFFIGFRIYQQSMNPIVCYCANLPIVLFCHCFPFKIGDGAPRHFLDLQLKI